MFCKWCGNKIANNGVPCPTCGKEQDALENGNGFWDLCEVEPKGGKQGTIPLVAEGRPNVSDEKQVQAKRGDDQKAKKCGNAIVILVCALCLMVAVGVIESSIALIKASKCMDEMDSVKTQLSGLRTDVSNGVSEIEEHIDAVITTTDTQSYEVPEDNDVNDDIDEILNSQSAVSIEKGVISIEAHEIESIEYTRADTVLIVSGYPVESARLVWQQFNKQTEAWDTIAEKQDYILLKESDEMKQIRVLCITQKESEEYVVYGAFYVSNDATVEPDDSSSED